MYALCSNKSVMRREVGGKREGLLPFSLCAPGSGTMTAKTTIAFVHDSVPLQKG